ncbi:MAG: hypothetical protein RI897_3376 [Verrucomicrobiota bacterium]|jgi:photosystem II stability/assembly factor-like uncharacterized protein
MLAVLLSWQCVHSVAADWDWLNPSPQGNDLNDVHVIDSDNIVAVGPVGTIIKSSDGGLSWRVLDSGSIWELNGVWFTDAQSGWVASERGLLQTTDGGETWSQQPGISVNDPLFAVHFVDGQNGWAAGGSGKVFKTSDGGSAWIPQTTGLPVTISLEGVHFVDTAHGCAVGSEGTIVRTTDGGATWESVASGVVGTLHNVHFVDQDHGWIVGAASTLLKTADGGQSWTPITQSFGIGENATAVHFTSALEGWLITTTQIWSTTDGGDNWVSEVAFGLPDGRALSAIDFHNPARLCVAGFAGVVYTSSDAGANWIHGTPGVRQSWTDGSFVSTQVGWIVGDQGSIYKTTDSGLSWVQQSLPDNFTSGFHSVQFLDEQTGWVIGATGRIYATTDGGTTWTRQTSGSTRTLRSVFFLNPQVGWVVGDSGTLLHTVNGGQDWSPQVSGVTTGLRAVQFLDENTGWVVGLSSTVLHTSNGGQDWVQPDNSPTGNLNALHFLDDQTGWAVGVGTIYRTTNGGADWMLTLFPLNPFQNLNTAFFDIHFADRDHGAAVGADGVIVRTADGGDNWELVYNPSQNPFDPPTPRLTDLALQSVQLLDSRTGWAFGTFGMVLRLGELVRAAPVLSVMQNQPGMLELTWSQDGTTWALLTADAPTAETWQPVNAEPVDEAGQFWRVALPIENSAQFFQLRAQGN